MDFEALLSQVQWSSKDTRVFFPSDPNFSNETQRWNAYETPTYQIAIRPGSEEDVQKAVSQLSLTLGTSLLTFGRSN